MERVCVAIASPDFRVRIEQALPPGITVDKFVRTTLTAIQQNAEVIVDPPSLYSSAIRCAQDGLLPDGREAAFVVFRVKGEPKVQYMPMVGGLRRVAAGFGISLAAYAVHEHDDFDYGFGFQPWVAHKPPALDEDRGDPIGAYAVATDKRGLKYLEVMSRGEIEQVRAVSRAAQKGPWVDWWSEMARKTVVRRLWKQLPLADVDEQTTRVLNAVDEEFEFVKPAVMSVEEANVHAAIGRGPLPDDGGPVDTINGEAVEVTNGNGDEGSGAPVGPPTQAVTGAEADVAADPGGANTAASPPATAPVPDAPEQHGSGWEPDRSAREGADGSQETGADTGSAQHGDAPAPGQQGELGFAAKARIAQERRAAAGHPEVESTERLDLIGTEGSA